MESPGVDDRSGIKPPRPGSIGDGGAHSRQVEIELKEVRLSSLGL